MNDPENDVERHESVWLLLPWYVNDTLETAERRLVEGHLASCPSCGDELARCKALATALRNRQETAPSPHPIQLARLMERVEAGERGERDLRDLDDLADEHGQDASGASVASGPPVLVERSGGPTARRRGRAGQSARPGRPWSRILGGTPRPVVWALVGQLAALVLLAAAVALGPARRFQSGNSTPASRVSSRNAEYVTLSAPAAGGEATAVATRPQIRLVFADSATAKQMRYVLLSTRGRLVDGPSPLGAYTLELPAPAPAAAAPPRATLAEAAPDSVGTVLAYLRSQPIVRFAEPVAGTTSPPPAPVGQGAAHGSPPAPRP